MGIENYCTLRQFFVLSTMPGKPIDRECHQKVLLLAAIYAQELEMMYFLVEPVFERAGAFEVQWASEEGIADIITWMIR
ncbi:hypothetical protein [Gibbsiella quercinecans]|uniref:hypothetical protein n=1 Tax=Gibbsiella quercinecans TaxID=929813 RepID=UPI00242DF602|nr:hypothetical protein [Gibbsiella quercinecans]